MVDRCGEGLAALKNGWCGYHGPSLLQILEQLPTTQPETTLAFSFAVQWVEKFSSSSDTSKGRRIFWGRVGTGSVQVGHEVSILPSGKTAKVAQVLNHVRVPGAVTAGHSAGIVLDREVDVSRGDWITTVEPESVFNASRELTATVAWMDDEPLLEGRVYWALHGHRWVKAKVKRILHKLNVNSLAQEPATQLDPNSIGLVQLSLQEAVATLPYVQSRVLGSLVLVDTASHRTSGAALVT